MTKPRGNFPIGSIGPTEKFNVAVQRPTVDMREAENVASQAVGSLRRFKQGEPVVHTKYGSLASQIHPLDQAFRTYEEEAGE
jgi:hypothetical protein